MSNTIINDDVERCLSLSLRQLQCIALVADGYTTEEIAQVLAISFHTANHHIEAAIGQLRAVNRANAVLIALRSGLID